MIKFDARQLDGLKANLQQFCDTVKTEVAFAGAAAMANVIYEEAKTNVPVESGLLRDSIYRVYSPEKSSGTLKLYRISWNKKRAPHGHLIEFGTSRAPAHPFLGPALSRTGDAITAGHERMAKKLDEIKGKS